MPGIQLASRPEASTGQLDVRSCRDKVKLFLELVYSCLGPGGKIKLIQNCAGGHLTITSSSSRLLSAVSINNPVLKFICSSIQSHINSHGDGGLLFAVVSSSLVYKGLDTDINRRLLSEVFEFLLTLSLEYLNADDCIFRYHVDLSDINFMTAYLRSILKTKPLCSLKENDIKHLIVLLLECFLNSLNENVKGAPSDNVYIIATETETIKSSQQFQGVLLVAPELSSFKELDLSIKRTVRNGKDSVCVALVSSSLSGDLEEVGGLRLIIEGEVDVESSMLDHLAAVCESWVQAGVGLLLCQKVVHPCLKKLLQLKNVLVVDRIGIQPVRFLSKLTGATPISCLDTAKPPSQLGSLDDVKHRLVHGKSYLQLIKADNCITTLLLTHRQEQVLNEVKMLCKTALSSLDQLLSVPYVLCGGGCWQAGLIHHIQYKVQEDVEAYAEHLEMSKIRFVDASQMYIGALLHTLPHQATPLLYNSSQGHLYTQSHTDTTTRIHCCCGLSQLNQHDQFIELNYRNTDSAQQQWCVKRDNNDPQSDDKTSDIKSGCKTVPKKENIVWDSLSVRKNALQMSVLTACSALRIGHVMDSK